MHARQNTRLLNKEQQQGNTANYFENLSSLVQVNDGLRNFTLKTVDCHDQAAPFNESQETIISITHSDHDISQITDGFLTFKIQLTLQLNGSVAMAKGSDELHLNKLFVGWKSSNQIIDQLQILNNHLSTGYQQNESVREGFAYSCIKPKQEKKTKKYVHSPYENVMEYSQSVCGVYINVDDFADGQPHQVEFEANLPFDDLLALQAFDMYPNKECGELELKFYSKHKGLVWCPVDVLKVKEAKEFFEGIDPITNAATINLSTKIKHGFTQIGNSASMICKLTTTDAAGIGADVSAGTGTLYCTGMTITSLKSNMYGFKVCESTKAKIHEIFSVPQIIPSQQLDYNAFPIAATKGGIQSTINMPITNCTCIAIAFPKYDNEYTVFENPVYSNLQLTINGQNMPDEVVNSQGARFLQQQLIAGDLSGGLECTQEFEDSMTMTKNAEDGSRYANGLRDASSFLWLVQTERNNAGYTFDGFDSGGLNVPVQIRGQPIYTGANDTYYYINPLDTSIHPPPPQIWICHDTYFSVSNNGVKYVANDTPPEKIAY